MTTPSTTRHRPAPRIGFIRPGQIERAFMAVLYFTLFALVTLSVIGTFYGLNKVQAPLTAPLHFFADVSAAPGRFVLAIGIQIVLTVVQYGARQMARHDRRWWLLYLVALSVSVYYNVEAYWAPLIALTAWYVAALLIVSGDVLPEFLAVRRSD